MAKSKAIDPGTIAQLKNILAGVISYTRWRQRRQYRKRRYAIGLKV